MCWWECVCLHFAFFSNEIENSDERCVVFFFAYIPCHRMCVSDVCDVQEPGVRNAETSTSFNRETKIIIIIIIPHVQFQSMIFNFSFFFFFVLLICCHSFKGDVRCDVCTPRGKKQKQSETNTNYTIHKHVGAFFFNYEYVNMQSKAKIICENWKIKWMTDERSPATRQRAISFFFILNISAYQMHFRSHFFFRSFLFISSAFSCTLTIRFPLHIVRAFVSPTCLYVNRLNNE